MSNEVQIKCNVDICFCIDATGSMAATIENVRRIALQMHETLKMALEEKARPLENLRMKVVVFRDFKADGADKALVETRFFDIPSEVTQFQSFVNDIKAEGGGDIPENGLEALSMAFTSDWVKTGSRKRHIVVLFTDADAHELGNCSSLIPAQFEKRIAQNFMELSDMWNADGQEAVMNQNAKRLIIFAPDCAPWKNIHEEWGGLVVHVVSKAGEGCEDVGIKEICNTVAGSV